MKIPEKPPSVGDLKGKSYDRKLFENLANPEIRKIISEVNSNYLTWEEFKYKSIPKGLDHALLWIFVKYTRDLYIRKFDLNNISFKFSDSFSSKIQQDLHDIDMDCGGILDRDLIVPKQNRESYLLSSLMEEAIASSQLEGAATSRKIAKEMLRTKRKPRNKDELMISNNYATMNLIVNELKGKELTLEMIKQIHTSMTKGTLENGVYEGSFRDNDLVRVWDKESGEVLHVPLRYSVLPTVMKEICDFANSAEPYIHPVVKASILHFLIGYVHPFEDGNGRTARAIFYWYLLSKGYWLFEFLAISRIIKDAPSQYSRAYVCSEQDENDMTYFIKFQIDKIKLALRDLKEYVKRKAEEKTTAFDFVQIPGVNERQAVILSMFLADPRKSTVIAELQDLFKVVYQTARNDLLELEKMGFLKKKVLGKKMIFFRSDTFNILVPKSATD
ncbi:MAG: Fic family protein [Candidatus Micrarchaeota archaeon]